MYRLSALLLLLTLPVAAAEPLRKLSLGVRIDGGSQALPLAPPVSQFLAAPLPIAVAAGRLLLHRRGCTDCHDLDVPAYPHTRGPDLDLMGRMPRVRMG